MEAQDQKNLGSNLPNLVSTSNLPLARPFLCGERRPLRPQRGVVFVRLVYRLCDARAGRGRTARPLADTGPGFRLRTSEPREPAGRSRAASRLHGAAAANISAPERLEKERRRRRRLVDERQGAARPRPRDVGEAALLLQGARRVGRAGQRAWAREAPSDMPMTRRRRTPGPSSVGGREGERRVVAAEGREQLRATATATRRPASVSVRAAHARTAASRSAMAGSSGPGWSSRSLSVGEGAAASRASARAAPRRTRPKLRTRLTLRTGRGPGQRRGPGRRRGSR